MTYLYWKWDKAIPKDYCEIILNNINWNQEKEATIDKNVINKKVRKTKIVWQPKMSVIDCIADKYIKAANLSAGWNFNLSETEEIQIGKYGIGGFYKWHMDDKYVNENPRKLSFTLLLNDKKFFEGGNLEFKGIKEQPILEQGSIIVFLSSAEHRVTPVTKGERVSAVTWMHGPNFK
jgi:PKHD-type hydroxylase